MEKIIIFGTGNYYQKYKHRFENSMVLALVDNAEDKQGKKIDGKEIISLNDIHKYKYDYIVILIKEYQNVYDQLLKICISPSKIITINPNGRFALYRKINEKKKGSILLISHDMNLRGAPLMLYEAAKIIKEYHGVDIDVATTKNGALNKYYDEEKINVRIFDDFIFNNMEIIKIFGEYRLIIVNTLVLANLIPQLSCLNSQIIWWIHEEWSAYNILQVEKNIFLNWNNLHIYGVGSRAIQAFYDYFGKNKKVDNLQWGIPENNSHYKKEKIRNKKIVFSVIGPVCRIKGQDILLKIAGTNRQDILSKIKIRIVGYISDENRKMFEYYSCFEVCGEVDYKRMAEIYRTTDVVLSTSRNDTMPVVLVEGLMNKKICMTSDGTGVSDYITNFINGIVFKKDDFKDLLDKIEWIVGHRDQWESITEKGYELYKSKYSMDSFVENIDELLDLYYINT